MEDRKKKEIRVGNYIHHIVENSSRRGIYPDPNYKNTGMALFKVTKARKRK